MPLQGKPIGIPLWLSIDLCESMGVLTEQMNNSLFATAGRNDIIADGGDFTADPPIKMVRRNKTAGELVESSICSEIPIQ